MEAPRSHRVPRPNPRRASAFLAGALLVAGCRSSAEARKESEAELAARIDAAVEARLAELFPEVEGRPTRDAIAASLLGTTGDAPGASLSRWQAIEALRRGDDEGARRNLSELRAAGEAAAAREHSARGELALALAAWERAVEIAPHSAALRLDRGDARLALGVASTSASGVDRALCAAAREDFLWALGREATPRAAFGAARAELALGAPARAWERAREGFELAALDPALLEGLPESAERTLARAAWETWSAADEATRATHAREACAALEALVGRECTDAWAWERLAILRERAGEAERARAASLAGLVHAPRSEGLYEPLERSTRALGGGEAVIATFERIEARDPRDAQAAWRPAQERWRRALEQLVARQDPSEMLHEAGTGFARAAALDPALAGEAQRALARTSVAAGLWELESGRPAEARAAFLAAEARARSELSQPLAPSLPTAIEALGRLLRAWRDAGFDPARADAAECLAHAAECSADLHRLAPEGERHVAEAARLAQLAAQTYEVRARERAARGRAEEARADAARARELMETAYAAACEAARLAPEDPALARAPGAILVHFLERDVPQAEGWLKRAAGLREQEVARLRAELANAELSPAQRAEKERHLEEALVLLGDTWKDLGVLHLLLKSDPHGARAWFERSLGVGRDPREDVRGAGGWLERCEAALQAGGAPRARERWGSLPAAAPDAHGNVVDQPPGRGGRR